MAIDYARMSAVALRLITENGRAAVLRKIKRTPQDPNKPWDGPGNQVDATVGVTAVFVDAASASELGRRETRGPEDSTKRGFEIAWMAALENPGVDLAEYDRMLDGGKTYKISKMHVLHPGSTVLVYEAEVER